MTAQVRPKDVCICCLLLAVLLVLTGCFRTTAEELYSLPQASDEYLKLQKQINTVLNGGAEYSPPLKGTNRQSVQTMDLSGDGKNEVIAFFSRPANSTLMIYIFEYTDGDYTVADIIEGYGTAIDSVQYIDMDGDGILEVAVGWQIEVALRHLSIYSVKDFAHVKIAEADYTELAFYDLTGDNNHEAIVLKQLAPGQAVHAEFFSLMPDGEVIGGNTRLADGFEQITRIFSGRLSNDIPALFVEGNYEGGGIITNILAVPGGGFTNVSLLSPSDMNGKTIRPQTLPNCADLTRDGITEIPVFREVKAQSDTSYYVIDWYAFNSAGLSRLELTTYHNNNDSWYLVVPFDWRAKVSIRREDLVTGERTLVFSYISGPEGPFQDILKIYTLSGDNKEERAKLPGRFILLTERDTVFAAEIMPGSENFGLTIDQKTIKNNFRLIYSD